ncbi:Gamma-D-glutamyl-L-diamino acid endopeptidase 1 [Oceanobacillus picturae]|uniref:Gamma-D-glutamyl-L-diamino acid endopeptidase 1 n=1 Tax=Oceanobacillus picturae TaxID=171693 RepID=W9AHF5_9BACI|nr:M14 family metallopeptidase [Oceanobacillus picturae]RIU96233.1 LysM peptidoglycan-binding domain-containing protein [Oceanobacillus picturae]CDO02096.1 Gamma-D-glutamyl-L-diamino acid endopeptidase 1 [Oceanobacillus picturae]
MEITIRQGDSLWYYSQLFGIPLVLIEQSNFGISPNQLSIGQNIQIPGYVNDPYNIQENDTLYSISIRNNVPLDMLFLANGTLDPSNLQQGQLLQIPQKVNAMLFTDPDRYTYDKMLEDLQALQEVYPFIRQNIIGNSVMGKDLIELQIGNGAKQVHLNGSFHANEWITTPVIIRFLNEYALALTNHLPIRGVFALPLFTDTTFSIVPMVNPDGVNLVLNGAGAAEDREEEVLEINSQQADFSNWKANIRGVDLNNQYPALWEVEAERKPTSPEPRDFPGYAPLTEPEAIAMAELARQRDFVRVNALHTQGEEIYWGFEGFEPPESEQIVMEYARVSGYEPIQYIDSYAGYKDWFIQEFQLPGFTIELGSGVNPLPIEQYEDIYQETLGIMLANLYL